MKILPRLSVLATVTATGAKLWQANYNPGGLSTSSFSAVAVSPDSLTVFVAGTTQPKVYGPSSVVVAAYDAAPGAWDSGASSIEVSPDGSEVLVTGDVNIPEPGTIPTMAAVAYSS